MSSNAEREVIALIQRYADCIDRGDLDGLAELFSSAVLRSPRGDAHGVAEVRALYDSVILGDDGSPGTHHVVFDTEVVVEAGGAIATAKSYVTVVQGGMAILSGRYHDRFVVDDGAWRFDERIVYLDLIGDLRSHLRMPT